MERALHGLTSLELRAQMVQFMKDNVASYHSIGDGVLKADMPEHLQYKSIEARIDAMATNTTMVGEMEIIATGKVLKRTIIIKDTKGNVINNFTFTEKNTPLTIQFKSFGHDAGHYDCVTTADVNTTTKTQTAVSNEAIRSLLETISPKPKASKHRIRKRKAESACLLTSSPYKEILFERETAKDAKRSARLNATAVASTKKAVRNKVTTPKAAKAKEKLQ